MPTAIQLQAWLEEAYAARHKLSTGKLPVSFNHGDRRLIFNPSDKAALDSYIAQLIAEIEQQNSGGKRRRRTFRATQTGSGF